MNQNTSQKMTRLCSEDLREFDGAGFLHLGGLKCASTQWSDFNFEVFCQEMQLQTKDGPRILSDAGKYAEYKGVFYIYRLDGQVWVRMVSLVPIEGDRLLIEKLKEKHCPNGRTHFVVLFTEDIKALKRFSSADLARRKVDPYWGLDVLPALPTSVLPSATPASAPALAH